MRKGVGVKQAIAAKKQREAFQEKGAALTDAKLEDMKTHLAQFKVSLEEFARKHATKINQDPEFRSKFQAMCSKVGVDPLSSSKGFWAEVLGVGSFFYELGVQILHVCIATRESNGGIMQLSDLTSYLQRIRSRKKQVASQQEQVTEDDVKRAIGTLEPLGNGVKLVQIGARKMLVSVPLELSNDHASVLDLAQENRGAVSQETIGKTLKWDENRTDRTMQALLSQGMAWIDLHDGKVTYWFPSLALSLM